MTARLRCAIYTRKSTEEGLEQDFNSLHAQRESCEAYVLSQTGEGWTALKDVYDDGGFSGGSMERPALKRLLADIEAGRIDVVVVYKVDRITRSLSDFARIVDVFDRRGVSFVSVTQSFNTTTSMGRLTLNVLLSFAQFEREVTGERIRDKIAASKAKGMWMGGIPPLGYDAKGRKVTINRAEAATVRRIFDRYLELGSVRILAAELAAEGARSKAWTTQTGKQLGGGLLSRGAVFHILRNQFYVGKITHKGAVYPGQHEAIISQETFDGAAAKLSDQAAVRRETPVRAISGPLAQKLFDAAGEPMSPSFSYGRGGRLYRYYIAMALQTGGVPKAGAIPRVSATAVEGFLVTEIGRLSGRDDITPPKLAQLIHRVELRTTETHLVLNAEATLPAQHPDLALSALKRRLIDGEEAVAEKDAHRFRIVLTRRLQLRGGRTELSGACQRPAARPNPGLVAALKRAHSDLAALKASPLTAANDFASAASPTTQHDREVARLAFLAPEIQRRIIDGRHAPDLQLRHILRSPIPLAWPDQLGWFESLGRP